MQKQVVQKSIYGVVGLFSAIVLANVVSPAPQTTYAATVPASSLTVSSSVNAYIASHGLQPVGITQDLHDFEIFDYQTTDATPNGVVFHYTDNATNYSARNEANYEINGGWENAFVHTFIDASTILNIHDIEKGCWGAGPQANKRFVQFELVSARNAPDFAKSINNAAYYVAYLAHHFGWKLSLASANAGMGTLWTHYDVSKYLGGTNHVDPIAYLNKWGYNTTQFFDLVKAHYNNKAEFPHYDITNEKTVSRKATLNQGNRNDGLFASGPYKTSDQTLKPTASAKAYNGQTVTVTKEAQTQTGTWNYVTLSNGQRYWIDKRGLTTLYNTVSNYQKQNYLVTLAQSQRSDGLFAGGAWFTNASSENAAASAKAYNGQYATVIASETTKSQMSGAVVNWVQVQLSNGKTYWLDARGVAKVGFYAISGRKAVNQVATIAQAQRSDGLFVSGPYKTSTTTLKADASAKSLNGQSVTVTEEATTKTATWAHIRLANGKMYWIDARGLNVVKLYALTDKQTTNTAAVINQAKRSDGMFANGPYKTSANTLKPDAAAKTYNNQAVTVIATAKTASASWAQIRLSNGKTYWIDARGLKTANYYSITATANVNQVVQIKQAGRKDGLFTAGPYKTSAATLKANASAAAYNGQYAQVTQIAKTATANWDKVTFNDGKSYWIDARGAQTVSTYQVSGYQALKQTAKLNQTGRNDGLFASGPYRTSAQSMVASASAKAYNGQNVQVLATENTATATWVQIQLNNGKTYWIDARGLTVALTQTKVLAAVQLTDNQQDFLAKITPQAQTVANANGLYPSVIVAQAIIESNWGTSELAMKANNFFGIKATKDWQGATYTVTSNEYVNGKTTQVSSSFRKYDSVQAGLADYATKIKTSPYYLATWRQNAADGITAAAGLSKWATDPNYTKKVVNDIKNYELSALDD